MTSPAINESSGLAASPSEGGVFYTHNDSGDKARFFRFNKAGKVTGEFSLKGVKAVDWEDMAAAKVKGKSWIYLADIGDNERKRDSIQIHRVAEPSGKGGEIAQVETYTLTYPDKKRDCEAFMVDPRSGDFWLVSKARDQETVAYRLKSPQKSGSYVLEKVGNVSVDTGGLGGKLVTGGDISPDGRHVVIRTYSGGLEFDAPVKFVDWITFKPRRVKTAMDKQGEAIAYNRTGSALLTSSEGQPCPIGIISLRKTD